MDEKLFTCAECQRTLRGRVRNQKYCGLKCRNRYTSRLYRHLDKLPPESRCCLRCGQDFETTDNRQRYCSRLCQKSDYYERRKNPVPIPEMIPEPKREVPEPPKQPSICPTSGEFMTAYARRIRSRPF